MIPLAILGISIAVLAPLQSGSVPRLNFETIHARKDGSTYVIEVRLQYRSSEKPPVYVAFIQDVTHKKQIENKLMQAQKMEAVGQLTGGHRP